jgi:2-oxo-4-hydroxy-4-carboxy--5-ureidoimidazoline (OHCU) decarboxylase
MSRHSAEQCNVLKQHPHLARALVAASPEPPAADVAHQILKQHPTLATAMVSAYKTPSDTAGTSSFGTSFGTPIQW